MHLIVGIADSIIPIYKCQAICSFCRLQDGKRIGRCIASFVEDRCPACRAAVTTVDHWKVLLCLLGIQIMRDGVSNLTA